MYLVQEKEEEKKERNRQTELLTELINEVKLLVSQLIFLYISCTYLY